MDYIDRQKLIKHIKADIQECGEPDTNARPVTYGTILGLKGALSFAQTLPTADVVEVKHGKWIDTNDEHGRVRCSICGAVEKPGDSHYKSPVCPLCGAKMDGGKK